MFEVQRVKTISISEGEVVNIKDINGNILWQKCDYIVLPSTEEKAIPVEVISVSSGDKITIYYYLTSTSGILYDSSNCGGGSCSANTITPNAHGSITFVASKTGKLIIAGQYSYYQWGIDWSGSLGMSPPYGDYIKIKVN